MKRIVGHRAPQGAFEAALASGALHHAWLLTGPPGVGKASFALATAARLLARDLPPGAGLDAAADGPDARLMASGSHPDLRVLSRLPKDAEQPGRDLARAITVAQVRSLGPMLGTAASLGGRRVLVVDAADDLERPGANALLKSLEEPPAGAVFLLVSHAPGRLLPTIRSRCRVLRFEPLSAEDTAAVLRAEQPDLPGEELAALAAAAGGSPGAGVRLAGLDVAALDAALARVAATGDPDMADRLALADKLGSPAAQPRYELFLERAAAHVAAAAHSRSGAALRVAIDVYDQARSLAAAALAQSLDPRGTVFEMTGLVARLASRA